MENIMIRKIASHEVESAMALALEVFMQFEAPDCPPKGVETFKKDIVENTEYLRETVLFTARLTATKSWR